jgi:hypothetical protein
VDRPVRGGNLQSSVDVVAVVCLSAVALLGLDDSYSSRAYLVTGMIAVVVMTAWSLLCSVQRYPAGVYLLVASLGFPVLGATVALHNYDLLGFPAPRAMGDLLTATITATGQFLTTIPPVDATGAALVIPYLVGYVLCGPAAWLALRTRRPLLPALPLVNAMVVCIVLGTEQPPALLIRAVVFAGLVLAWVAARAARLREVGNASRGRGLRAVVATALAVVAVLVASAWLPAVPHQDRHVLRGRVGSGADVSQLDNPLATFRKYTPQPRGSADNLADKRLLRVAGLPRGDVLRIVALDVYDGTAWVPGNRTVPDDSAALFQRIGSEVGAPRPGRPVRVGVEVQRPWTSNWLPVAGQLTGVTFDYLDGRAQRDDVRYNVATQTGLVVGGLQARDDYHLTGSVPDATLRRSMQQYGDGTPLMDQGAFLDRYLRPWRTSRLSPMRQVFSLARYLRTNGRYSDGAKPRERIYPPGQSPTRLGPGFIGGNSIVGDDEQYAAFMALAANRLGVPARVVVGATPDRQGWVRGHDVQAWVEVRVADGSWRMMPDQQFMSHRPPVGAANVRQSPSSYVKATTPEAKPSAPPPLPQSASPLPTAVQHAGRNWPIPLAAFAALLLEIPPVLKVVRRRRRRRATPASARFVGGWAEVLDRVRDLGQGVPDGLSRTEQARRLGLTLELARSADLHVFGRGEPTAEEAATFWRGVTEERRRLGREAGALRRVVAVWAPWSLLESLRGVRRRRRRGGSRGRRWRAVRPVPEG